MYCTQINQGGDKVSLADRKSFSKGYAKAEELLQRPSFDFPRSLAHVLREPPFDPYDEGLRARLIEEDKRRRKERKDND